MRGPLSSFRRSPTTLALLAGLILLLPGRFLVRAADPAPSTEKAALQAAAALYDGIRSETLPNGLRVYLKPVPGSPVVTTMVAYRAGSADEDLENTGLAHYLEHLMFKGTDKIRPGDIDRLTLRNGGRNNAYTSEDYTAYHFDFAADRWEAALQVEADRMRNLRIDTKHEFEQEKGAVVSELEQNEDEPWDLEMKAMLPLLFGKTTPYGHPIIGERAHVRGATAEIIKGFYDKWYHPNNAALIVCGGFDPDKALAHIKELFGPIPAGKLPERKPVPEPPKRAEPVRHELESKFELPRMILGYNTVRSSDPDFHPLQVLQEVLTGGKTGRLYKKLVEGEEIANLVSASNSSGRYPGWFSVSVELQQGKDRAKAEQLVLAELQRLRDEPVTAAELKRVQQSLISSAIFGRESVHGLADSIAQGVMLHDLDFLKNYLPRILAVTAEDVQRVVKKYLDPQKRVVVWSVPKKGVRGQGAGGGEEKKPPARSGSAGLSRKTRQSATGGGGSGEFSLKDAKRVELPNGLVVLLFENHRLPIVVAQAAVRNVRLHEPAEQAGVAALTGALLDEGTSKHSGPEIAELIENVGGTLTLGASGSGVQVLTPHRKLGLDLLFECLTQANFPKDAFARQKARLLSQIDNAEQEPETKAQMVYRELVYGKHPFGRPGMGRRKTVEKLTPADCAAFFRRVFVPNNTVVAIVGDFDSKEVMDQITHLTADWKKAPVEKPEVPGVEKPPEFSQKIVSMPGAAQLHFYMGHVGIRRNSPDFYKLLVMDYVLGTGPGFTDRLSARLRDREGLAYTVSATITSSASEEPGQFTCYIGTQPDNFAKVKGMFLEELNRIRTEKAAAEEVEDAKKYLLGSLAFELTTNEQIAQKLLLVERFGLGFGYLDDFRKAVAAVTPEDVLEVAQKYIDPKHMFLVAAGALDKDGKPITKLPPPKP